MACLENLIQVIFSVWVQFPKEPSVFVTVAHHHAGLKRDAASIWLEDITRSSFKICLRELQNYAGSHEDIYVVCSILHFLPFYVLSQHYICCALSCVKLHNVANFLFLSIFLSFSFSFFFFLFSQNWLAFSSLDKPMFSEHSSVYFANSQKPAVWNNNAFCKVSIKSISLSFIFCHVFTIR